MTAGHRIAPTIHRRVARLTRVAAVASIIVSIAVAQGSGRSPAERPPVPAQTPPENLFLDGWMAELIDGDRSRAQQLYRRAAANPQLPGRQSELSLLRLWESSPDYPTRMRHRNVLRARDVYHPELFSQRITRLAKQMKTALGKDDAEGVAKVRSELAAWLARNPTFDSRSVLPDMLAEWRGDQAADPELERLKRERQAALKQDETKKAAQLARQISLRQWAKTPQAARRRLVAKRRTKMTRLHLRGEHDRATGMEKFLGSHGRRLTRRQLDLPTLIARLHRLDQKGQQAELVKVQANIARMLRWRSLFAVEKAVLRELRTRLTALTAAKQRLEALLLAARIPYRSVLFH